MADAVDIGLEKFETTALRIAAGLLVLEIGRIGLHKVAGQLRSDEGVASLFAFEAATAEIPDAELHGPLILPRAPMDAAAGSWSLAPLAAADGTIRAEIIDAHLSFDADVTVPIRQGQVDFDEATVEHVGPDSSMGVSKLGLYVDAPNGRSYLYQFPATPLTGVAFEHRGALLGRVADRGKLRLQEFIEGMLHQAGVAHGLGITEQARLLLGRTSLSGEVQLADGKFAAPGMQAELTGRAAGRNLVRLHSEAVGRGVSAEIALLSVRNAQLNAKSAQLACDEITGALLLHLFVEGGQLRFELKLADVSISGLRVKEADARAHGSPAAPPQPSPR